MFAEDGEGVARSLFAGFLRHVRSGRPESIIVEALASRPVVEQFQRLGFRNMRTRGAVFVYCPADSWTRLVALQDPDGWLLMKSDQDG
jgi:hypothetical protein